MKTINLPKPCMSNTDQRGQSSGQRNLSGAFSTLCFRMSTSSFAVLSLAVICFWASSVAARNKDVDALVALKRSLSDPDHVLDSWDPNLVDPCTWFYITCNTDDRVIRVDLGFRNLGGVLPPQLGNLDALQNLELYKNNIRGTIPPELGKLTNLRSLDLYNNHISGTIPRSLGNLRQLMFLRLNDNPLSGRIPPEVARLPNLRILDTSNTRIVGPPWHEPPAVYHSDRNV